MAGLGMRYGTSLMHGELLNEFATLGGRHFNQVADIFGSFYQADHYSRLYVSPARYSGVRKVTFWVSIRHEQTGGQATFASRLRIAPQSTSTTARNLVVAEIARGQTYDDSISLGSIWNPEAKPTAESALYPLTAARNDLILRQYTTDTTAGCDMLFCEFDRFEADSSAFFADWDAVANSTTVDNYIAFRPVIERADGGTWSVLTGDVGRSPQIVGFGMTVVQAPQAVNKTCVYLPISFGLAFPLSMTTVLNEDRVWLFPFRSQDWDGTYSLNVLHRHSRYTGVQVIGNYSISVYSIQDQQPSASAIIRYTENFPTVAGAGVESIVSRSGDITSSIQDGDNLGIKWKSNVGLVPIPRAWMELIQTSFNKTRVFFPSGNATAIEPAVLPMRPPGNPPPDRYGLDESLFDPLWFENLPDDNILDHKVLGGLAHLDAGNDSEIGLVINADLGADIPNSGLNAFVQPRKSSTPNATLAYKIIFDPITANDPINFAGKRKLKSVYNGSGPWSFGFSEFFGMYGFTYALFVPNREFLELGPIFDVGAFNPEGCAATSAGLGDNPGILVITNGSSPPKKFNPNAAGTSGEIEDAGMPTPFEGELPQAIADDNVCSPDGGLEAGIYKYRYTFRNCCTGKESDPNPEDITVDTTGATPCAKVDFSFAGIRIPADSQICEICLYRTLVDGAFPVMAKVGCFNPSETELFTDTVSDEFLDFTNHGLSLLNGPMPCVSIVVEFRDRLFGMGDIPNLAPGGTVEVVDGSDIVTGDGSVEWDRCLEGKLLQVEGDCRAYEILRVLPPEIGVSPPLAILKLAVPYEGESRGSLSYHICGHPNRLYWSEPFEPESWPAANFMDIEPGDGDRLMGAVSNFDSLVICKRRKTYLLRFNETPAEVFCPTRISSDIGCIGPRTFAQIEAGSVWLSDRGIVIFDGRTVQHLPASDLMNNLFIDPDDTRYVRRDRNGRVIDAVAVFYPKKQEYLLFVPTVLTTRGCNLMVVWDTKLNNVTIFEFCQEFQSMVVAKDTEGNERVYIGDTNGFVWILDIGLTDGVGLPNATGSVRGSVTAAGTDEGTGAAFLDDSLAAFIEGGLPGAANLSGVAGLSGAFTGLGGNLGLSGVCVFTRSTTAAYDDPWTVRTIFAATQTRLYVSPPWDADAPAVGDAYMIGAINFDCIFKPQNYGTDDQKKRDWRQILVHEIEEFASKVRIDLLPDFQLSDPESDTVETDGVFEGRTFLMDNPSGRQVRPVGRVIHSFMGVRIRNFAPEEPVRIINHALGVELRESK
jgi:hypothetical protein